MIRYFIPTSDNDLGLRWRWQDGVVFTVLPDGSEVKWGEPEAGLWNLLRKGICTEVSAFE